MNKKWHHQAIALAGMTQALSLIDKLAKTGYLDSQQFETSIKSLFETNPDTIFDVYGGTTNIEKGLQTLRDILAKGQSGPDTHIISYGLGVLHLQKRLSKNKKMLNSIASNLASAQTQSEHFGLTHDNVIANIANGYSQTLSTFRFRIQVSGDQQYLQQQRIADRVRALLLAAVRAATLWRQSGGNLWSLLFKRSSLLAAIEQLLATENR